MELEKIDEEQSEKEKLEKERIEKEQLEKERIEKQKMENKLFPNNMLFMIPSWSDLLGYPTLGTYVHHPVLKIISDPVIFLSGYDYSIETARGTLHYLFGLGYYFLKFELESGKYITDNRILTGLVLADFIHDHMATSANITLEEDHDVIIAEKVIRVPIDLSNKTEHHLTFIKGTLMRNLFIPNKDIFLEMMERIRKVDSYQIAKQGHLILSAHWDSYNQILVSDKMKGNLESPYLNLTAGLDGIIFAADKLLQETISNENLNIIEGNINDLKNVYSTLEFDPMYLFSIIENASKKLISSTPQISSEKRDSTTSKIYKKSIFGSAEDRLDAYIIWPGQFKRKVRKEPSVLPKIVEQPKYTRPVDTPRVDIGSIEISDYKQEQFELDTLKSEKVALKLLPDPPKADTHQILLYLKKIIEENYEMRSIGQAFEIARESMRQIGVSETTKHQTKIWEMSKYANIYVKKKPSFGLPAKEKQELIQKLNEWLFEIEEEERKEKERVERVRLERERLERARLEKERLERIAKERRKREQQEKERQERERLRKQQIEKQRLEKIERERQEEIRLRRELLEKERKEQEAVEKEKRELERLKQERKRKEKDAKQKAKKQKKLEKKRKKIEKQKQKEQERLKNL